MDDEQRRCYQCSNRLLARVSKNRGYCQACHNIVEDAMLGEAYINNALFHADMVRDGLIPLDEGLDAINENLRKALL